MYETLRSKIFSIQSELEFNDLALDTFRFQAQNNPVYKDYLHQLQIQPEDISSIETIPFLPIRFFKTKKIISGHLDPELMFTSSGTTGMDKSTHFIMDLRLYRESFTKTFRLFYGDPSNYHILALLPSYLEQAHSSLIYMVHHLIELTSSTHSGFYLDNHHTLIEKTGYLKKNGERQILLIGVSYALLDLAEKSGPDLNGIMVMETGGMKGRRKEMVREELHQILCQKMNVPVIHSEYGMTELLSQAYSRGKGIFRTPPWMKILVRDIYNPFSYVGEQRTGGFNIIDLANLYSCSFIETQDLGMMTGGDTFEVLGRFDDSEIRGCNLLVD